MTRYCMLAALIITAACERGEATKEPSITMATATKASADWQTLSTKKIFFGHQSVGRNIMEGVRETLSQHPEIGARLVTTSDLQSVSGPAFIDADVGRNGDPLSKTREFAAAVERGLVDQGAIALHKYCYVDVNEKTDIAGLFAAYREEMARVRARHPQLTIVHVTMPLRVEPKRTLKDRVKMVLGREVDFDGNPKRNEFNRLLLAEYGGKEPVFDLAALESTRSDGSRVARVEKGDTVYSLASEWTYDGGHLNETGRKRVAVELLNFLSAL